MPTVKEKLAAIRAKRFGLAPPPSAKPTTEPAENDTATAAEPASKTERPNEHVDKSPHKAELSASTPTRAKRPPVSTLFQSPSPANTPTPVRARRFRNDPRAARIHWRKKDLARARRHVVRTAINSDQYVYMTAPVPDEEKTPIVPVKAEGYNDDRDDGDDEDYNGDEDEDGEGADGEDDEEIALRTARELEKMRDSDNDADDDNENTEDFNDYDVNNYDNREDDEPENDVNGNLVIRSEENMVDENDNDADNDSDHVQEKEDLAPSISNADGENINERAGEGDSKKSDNPNNTGGSENSKSQGDAHEKKISDIVDHGQNSETSPEAEGPNDKEPTNHVVESEQRSIVQEQTSKPVEAPCEEVSKSGLTAEVTEKSDCKAPETKPANITTTTTTSTMTATATSAITPTKKKKKQSKLKVQSVLSFSRSSAAKGKTGDAKSKSARQQDEAEKMDGESSAMCRSEADSHIKALGELEDDESETVRRPREKPMISDDETEFVGGGRMFEDEAEEDDNPKQAMNDISDDEDEQAERYTDDDGDTSGVRRRNNDDDDDDDRDIDEVVPDTEQMEDEKVAMASFHRHWEMEQEKKEIEAATNGGVRRLFAESDELNDDPHVIAGSSDDPAPITAGSNDAANSTQNGESSGCVGAEGHGDASDARDQKDQKSAKKDASADYMEAMFRRDDSRSVVIDDVKLDEDEEAKQHEARREQQRLLWKARQKFKSEMHQSNDDSLCHLDLFGDADKSKSKSKLININLRKKLESACRPATMRHDSGSVNDEDGAGGKHKQDDGSRPHDKKNGKKRTVPGSSDDSALPDWLHEKACLERRQQKRRRSVAVANWSFDRLNTSRDKDGTSNGGAAATKTGNKSSTAITSLGTTSNTVRKSRTTSGVTVSLRARQKRAAMRSTRAASSAGNSRNSASFKGLLSLLGQQAERHA